ncbi:hypothetical protein A9179_18345 [Pseudomonas alcaligenes]|uniref:MYND finger n=1 Tax=Aquipseudomonas alcaligenes TaxID=43263 RepID=A0ABR7S529_AQUAC|nr:PP0621 family protein [Pseudomonas alcaligenes]MBC9252234.1 hypothetical protein [Pseudomonas alcaligenes]
MFRLLFWIALITAAIWFWRRLKRPAATAQTRHEAAAAPMVRCAHCGVHVPQQQALAAGNLWYCSQPHLQQGPNRGER